MITPIYLKSLLTAMASTKLRARFSFVAHLTKNDMLAGKVAV